MAFTVHKPAGIPTLPPHADPGGDCVARRLVASQPERAHVPFPEGFLAGVLHRLDVCTSGAVWVADDAAELQQLRALFAAHALRKTYVLQAARDVPWDVHETAAPIAHDRRHKKRMVVARGKDTPHRGKWLTARTRFARLSEGPHPLFVARIETGVMHQIRVHAASLGLALAGDRLYGGGAPVEAGGGFHLHHIGLVGPDGLATDAVTWPAWARCALSDDVAAQLHHQPWPPPR